MPNPRSLPPNSRLVPAHNLRIYGGGEILTGGSPTRLLRLTCAGSKVVRRWFDGFPVELLEAHQSLARRLVDHGLASLNCGDDEYELDDVSVVIPVKDDVDGLITTLKTLADVQRPRIDGITSEPRSDADYLLPVIIVDDGSEAPILWSDLEPAIDPATGLHVSILRLATNNGPGAARNSGLEVVSTGRVIFVDADVVVTRQQVARLLGELEDPNTMAVAPRVVATPRHPGTDGTDQTGWVSRRIADYETRWSALDLGPHPGAVGPGRHLTYLPSTCLAVDVSTLRQLGGFDPDLRFGEDVDLIWRIGNFGWVRYAADIVVNHPPRSTLTQFVRQRFRYGTAAGPLARRHPDNLSPVQLSPKVATMWAALVFGHPLGRAIGLAMAASAYRQMVEVTESVIPGDKSNDRLALHFLAETIVGSGLGLATAITRTWFPGLLGAWALAGGRVPNLVRVALTIGLLRRARPRDPGSAVVDIGVGLIDDLAYSLGLWAGSRRARTVRPLLPRFVRSSIER